MAQELKWVIELPSARMNTGTNFGTQERTKDPRPRRKPPTTHSHRNTPTPQHPNTPIPQYPNTPTPQYPNTPTPQYPNTPTPQHPNTPTPQYPNTKPPANKRLYQRHKNPTIINQHPPPEK